MLPQSTLTYAALYGSTPPGHHRGDTVEQDSANASGNLPASLETAKPAIFWGVLVAMLVFVRLLYQWGGK